MKPLLLALVAATTAAAAAPLLRDADDDRTPIESLDWLSGRWVVEGGGDYLEETWSPAREDALVGTFRWAREGGVWMYELMSIEADDEAGLVFHLRHFDRGLAPWESEAEGAMRYPLASLEENRVVFENPERDSPRQFVYERDGDVLSISLVGADAASPETFQLELDD